ncbi:hypothetical protein SHJG_5479 [Streptomyces hygroscopicus subsp. jinggangensis 5008]|nr:hypothetical protein SHJG_5479 [Streptomyces hygroscopicus subsp. jinggangensis 5008]AGF64905.1 hypothetical protein SHJGH_5242 [Streptomyces hygroscopicus subsp. jinggangensis TL01]
MNGWGFAAVAVVCVTALGVVLLWAMVRLGQQQRQVDGAGMELVELSANEEFAAVQAHNEAGRADLRRQIAEAAERSRRRQAGE